jgi:hypothetical protein
LATFFHRSVTDERIRLSNKLFMLISRLESHHMPVLFPPQSSDTWPMMH